MAAYALQTKTMLQSVSKNPAQILGLSAKRDLEAKSQLPTKRKRESICRLGSFNKPFVVKPCPESPYDKPSTFKPVRIIGRSQLPLTFLDTATDESFAPNRLFSANIEVLESQYESQDKENTSPKVLIALHETNKALYAIERVQPRIFSLCKLARWLKEKEVADLWDPLKLNQYPTSVLLEEDKLEGAQWWQRTVVQTELEERPAKRPRISMLRPKPKPAESEPKIQRQEPAAVPAREVPLDAMVLGVSEMPTEAPSPQHLLETLVQQYLDAVYMSKTSLAYLTKGPITRIRTAFTSPAEGAPPTYDLVTFLRSMLISHKAGEKKYLERLPEVIKSIPPGSFSDEEPANAPSKPKKSKKKIKLSREGMFPQEHELVKKWWISEMRSPEAYGEETIDQRIKRRMGDLRVREALAQMILMLEIIALEALSTYKEPSEDEQPAAGEATIQGESQAKPKKRKKKLDDINLLLDLLLDKLCIWQSVDQDGILDFDAKPSKQGDAADPSGKFRSSDRLQSFCVEVIIPFYVSRLPEQAITINKKLGGPVHTSPPKRKAAKPPVTSRKSGEPKEPDAKKSRRTLGRVATDTATQRVPRGPTPALNRSNTDSAVMNGIKREVSEAPLSAIPFQRSPSQAARRSMSHFKHLAGRQIDLSEPSAAAAAKLKQKKRVEEDLKEAITALKKPNRNLAAGGYVDDIERRGLGSSNKSRKPTTTVRNFLRDVQVSATPRVSRRTKDIVEQTPSHHRSLFTRDHQKDTPPSSSFCVPSSGVRPSFSMIPGTIQRSTTARSLAVPSIAETPSKGPSSRMFEDSGACRRAIFATPLKGRVASPSPVKTGSLPEAIFATPTKGATAAPPPNIHSTPPAIFATPKETAHVAVSDSPLPTFSNPAKGNEEQSIYDALGWNDDDDLL